MDYKLTATVSRHYTTVVRKHYKALFYRRLATNKVYRAWSYSRAFKRWPRIRVFRSRYANFLGRGKV